MVDEFEPKTPVFLQPEAQLEAEEQGLIRLKHAEFNWGSSKGTDTPGFSLKVEDVTFVKGKINLITGPTGSGKSSFLKVSLYHLQKRHKLISRRSLASCTFSTNPDHSSTYPALVASRTQPRNHGVSPKPSGTTSSLAMNSTRRDIARSCMTAVWSRI
jgi:energy-coupling factor transporter ATP-binding protein EcfA2